LWALGHATDRDVPAAMVFVVYPDYHHALYWQP